MLSNFILFCIYPFGLSVLLSMFYMCSLYNDIWSNFIVKENLTSYDFIVVGAGTAGAIVATRLAENTDYHVLLIEAGEESNFLLDIPIITPLLQLSRYDWKYYTEPQENACFGLMNNSSRWPRGKVLGGSSRLNYALYVRGFQNDFDAWSMAGNDGWSYAEILTYFKKSEHQTGRFKNDDLHHSIKGEWSVGDPPWVTPMANAFVTAAEELGIEIADKNAKINAGFMLAQVYLENGKRCSSDSAFLRNAAKRGNLKIITNAFVEKVLFEDLNMASEVIYSLKGAKYIAKASKEIILSAGSIETPKILMLSGIGPKAHLNEFEIPVLRDLPVGKNLQDHVTTGTDLILLNDTLVSMWSVFSPLAAFEYFFKGAGPWTAVACEALGFLYSSLADSKSEAPDIQIMALPFGLTLDGGNHLRKVTGLSHETWSEYFQPLIGQPSATIAPVLLRPKSRGEIVLRSIDPMESPKINPQYLSHPDDVKVLIEGLRFVEKLLKTKALRKFDAKIYEKAVPGCESYEFRSDLYWECYVRHLTLTTYHPVGTCKMGPADDSSSVVDPQLRVHGTRNLRVIDASIMPTIVSGNTNAASMMIGEKGADMIRTFWDNRESFCNAEDSQCTYK